MVLMTFKSTATSACGRAAGPTSWMLAAALLLAPLASAPLSAQGRTVFGIRGGAGIGTAGQAVYGGQIEIVDIDGTGSVELAITGWGGARTTSDYEMESRSVMHRYHEDMRVWGFGVLGSYLWRDSGATAGPYVALGLGLGPLWVDWRADSTDPRFGTPAPDGGSFRVEEGVRPGSLLLFGIGQRLHERFDLRAQVLTLLVPSSKVREDAKLVPLFTLTSGIGL